MLQAASSSTGLVAYASGGDLSVGGLAWIDRSGAVEYLDVPERDIDNPLPKAWQHQWRDYSSAGGSRIQRTDAHPLNPFIRG